jgi:hypothetical protein
MIIDVWTQHPISRSLPKPRSWPVMRNAYSSSTAGAAWALARAGRYEP